MNRRQHKQQQQHQEQLFNSFISSTSSLQLYVFPGITLVLSNLASWMFDHDESASNATMKIGGQQASMSDSNPVKLSKNVIDNNNDNNNTQQTSLLYFHSYSFIRFQL